MNENYEIEIEELTGDEYMEGLTPTEWAVAFERQDEDILVLF